MVASLLVVLSGGAMIPTTYFMKLPTGFVEPPNFNQSVSRVDANSILFIARSSTLLACHLSSKRCTKHSNTKQSR